jgi:hypothetical protein
MHFSPLKVFSTIPAESGFSQNQKSPFIKRQFPSGLHSFPDETVLFTNTRCCCINISDLDTLAWLRHEIYIMLRRNGGRIAAPTAAAALEIYKL